MVGPGLGIDPTEYRVICASILGSPYGTTSPISINPTTGKTCVACNVCDVVEWNGLMKVECEPVLDELVDECGGCCVG